MDEEEIKRIIDELLGKLSIGGGAGVGGGLLSSPISPGSTSYNTLMGGDADADDGFLPVASATDAQLGAGGDRGFETPAMRDAAIKAYQGGLLPGTPAYREFMLNMGMGGDTFDVGLGIDGMEEGYTFTGDGGLSEVGMAQFRNRNNIQPNLGGGMDSSNLGFGQFQPADAISNLSSDFVGGFDTTRGLDTPAQRHSIGEIMGNLNLQEQNKVKMILQNLNDGTAEGRRRQETFLNGMMDGNIDPGGYGVQNEQILY